MTIPQDRRLELRRPMQARGLVAAPGLELACVIIDSSGSGFRLRLDRAIALPKTVTVVDIAAGTATEAQTAWTKGVEAGLKCGPSTSLRGLVPVRLAPAREAWLRAGGR